MHIAGVLDQLATGVAIFNADRKLIFYNTAFRSLFDLQSGLLDQTPTDTAVLDSLRSARKLPEEQDFRLWKQQLYEAYRAIEPKEHMWHLPDGRTLRVVTTPRSRRRRHLSVRRRHRTARHASPLRRAHQGAERDARSPAEAVAVFGSDGRVRLHNPGVPAHVEARRVRRSTPIRTSKPVTAWSQALHDDSTVLAFVARRGDRDRRARTDRRSHASGVTA